VAATRDPHDVGRHDEEKLRRYLAARQSGDEAAARRWWEERLTDNFDRVRAMVLLESRGRLSDDEQQEAVQRALIRIANNMIETFRGSSMGEWVESTRKLVKFACIDTQRRAAARSKHERSLNEAASEDDLDHRGRWDAEVYEAIEDRRREAEADEADAEALAQGQAFLDWAVPQLPPKRRAVVELDRDDVPVEEMQARPAVSRDVVYASRSRALKDLAKLREQYEG
jgi:hypothetical protein